MTGQLAGPADQIVPVMTAQRLVSELPDARLRLISDAGHHLPRRAPGAVAKAIAGFVAALDETAPAARVILGRMLRLTGERRPQPDGDPVELRHG